MENLQKPLELEAHRSEGEQQVIPQPGGALPLEHNVAGAVDGPDVVAVAVLLRVDALAHRRLANDVQGAVGDQGEDVKLLGLAGEGLEDVVTELHTMLVHHVEEILEDLEMEGGCQHLPPGVPLAASAGQEACPKPRPEEFVIFAL